MDDVANPTGKRRPKRRHHGEGSRPFRASGRYRRPWRCAVRLGRDPRTGKYRVRWFSGESPAEAAAARDAFLATLREAGSVEAAEMTVARLLDRWLGTLTVDPSTHSRYEGIVRLFLVPTIGSVPVAALTAGTVRDNRDRWGTSASSRNHATTVLRSAMRLAIEDGYRRDNPVVQRRLPRGESVARHLSADEALGLLDAFEGTDRLIVLLAMCLGARRGEVLGMRWADLDLDAGTLTTGKQLRHISPAYREHAPSCRWAEGKDCTEACEDAYRLVDPKAGHSEGRVIVLPRIVIDALAEHRDAQPALRRKPYLPKGLVFEDAHGQPLPPNSVTRRFQRIAKAAGLGHVRLHDLRHSAATMLLALGVPLEEISALLGHASIRQTEHYAKRTTRIGEGAAGHMDRAMRRVM